ncbi:MAG: ABC transporter ATP-binding protein [Clostridiales bacterium]|jgi:lipopolysaccharide transport system ATP-binding protein|nr:ABC transporter ATP-binding protein [Clostridiales bacterium]
MDDRKTVLKIENVGKKYMLRQKALYPENGSGLDKIKYKLSLNKTVSEDFWALKDINLDIKKGERVGIVGRNGAGKSTLLKLISRITEPTKGRIEYEGTVAAMLEIGTGFNPELTGRENVYLNGAILGMSREEIDGKYDEIVDFSEIGRFIDTPVKKYSSGMMVRLAFSVASTLNPDILIIDEVLSVGDMRFRSKCLNKMSEIANDGKTILCVSHMMNIIRNICDRAIVLEGGELIHDGDVEEAIRLYNGKGDDMRAGHYEYTIKNRQKGYKCDRLVIKSLDITDNADSVYMWDEPISFTLNIDALTDEEGIGMRIRFLRDDGAPAATAFIEPFASFKSGENSNVRVTIRKHNLAPGNYRGTITLVKGRPYDIFNNLDSINDAFFVTVLNVGGDEGGMVTDNAGRLWAESWGRSRITDACAELE